MMGEQLHLIPIVFCAFCDRPVPMYALHSNYCSMECYCRHRGESPWERDNG